ncbi:HD domain-containing phosphohydrolase [Poseidonibacter lekithochrous]|uniref:HD domain-containing phosphohydrolase n=1 Tax=Poseidonibacter lekithochrous TaxID=1904463 RepID=UPI0008FC79C0|nr:HD domain-containing phosphohydrolase [Poseidonibacter lekithochrous]QKJ21668.1 c-di-GMP phosphodiesterase, class II (HD-GYP domain) [Poseidonibacter lekithochrous]
MSLNNFSIKIKPTILGLFFTVTAIVVSVMLLMQYNLSKKIALESTQESFKQLSTNLKQETSNYIKNSESFIRLIENIPYLTEKPIPNVRHKVLDLFVSDIKSNNYIYSIYVGHKDGTYYELINLNEEYKSSFDAPKNASWLIIKILDNIEYKEYLDKNLNQIKSIKNDTKYKVTQRPWYKEAISSTSSIKTEPYLFKFLNKYGISYAKEIKNSDDIVIGIDVTLNNIDKLISKQKLVEDSEVFLFDTNGKIITYNKVSKGKISNNKSSLNQNTLDEKLTDNQFFYNKFSLFDNSESLYIISPIENIMEPYIKEIYWFILVSFIVFLIIAIPLIILSSSLIINPLHRIVKENEKIQKRKFDKVKNISSYIKEIHDVSDSLWKMSVSIKAYEENQKELMDSFIKLIATAIDEKSKYTGGHCNRVPKLALMIIDEANKCEDGIFKDFKINSEDEYREISISAWLHDCGKVTTPEYVVDKATKLETIYNRIHEIRTRFEVIYRDLIIESYKKELNGENKQEIDSWLKNEQNELKEDFEFIAKMNLGGEFLKEEYKERIKVIASRTWLRNFDNKAGLSREERIRFENKDESLPILENLLSDKSWHIIKREESINDDVKYGFKTEVPKNLYNQGEIYNLTISKGTLTEEERYKIQDHIKMTIKMLEQLPLPENLKNVPLYAGAHHETLIGTGYPKKLTKDEMPIPSRVLALADVFEALTASDRPYKDSKTLSESIKILSFMVKDQHLDKDIFELFLKTEVYKRYGKEYLLDEQIDEILIGDYL